MRGSETVKEDFKTQIFDIFGTVDLEQLRAIAQKVQLIESEKPHNERGAGRKNSLTPQQLAEMLALHQQEWEQRSWRKVRHQSPDDLQATGTCAELQ